MARDEESGQALTEYMLLLVAVLAAYAVVMKGLQAMNLPQRLSQAITQSFAYAYKYGDPQALGYDEGSPQHHPRIPPTQNASGQNFRIFISAGKASDGGQD